MVESYFVEAFNYAAKRGKKVFKVCDVDEAVLRTMSTDTSEVQRQLIGDLYDLSGGNVFFMTGRAHQSLDQAWKRNLPGSYEHHSMMRIEENGAILNLAPEINTNVVGRNAATSIGDRVKIVDAASQVWEAKGQEAVVYIEIKNSAVALVHSLGLDDSETKEMRETLRSAAEDVIRTMGAEKTHKVTAGTDAVEIVPLAPSLCAHAHEVLPDEEKMRIANEGLGKATGIHNIMALIGDGYIPIMLGDSPGSDGPAMKVCKEYGGYGIAVSNGNDLPADFLEAANHQVIPTYKHTWSHIEQAVSFLRDSVGQNIVDMGGKKSPRQMVAGMRNN